jgi:hypothetical protein
MLYQLKVQKLINDMGGLIGLILLALGIGMTYAGAKFLFTLIAAIVWTGVSGLIFLMGFNILPIEASLVALGSVAALSMVVGGFVAKYSADFLKKYAVTLLAGWAGVILALILCDSMKI